MILPFIKNIAPRLLADDIKGMSAEETRIAMKKCLIILKNKQDINQ